MKSKMQIKRLITSLILALGLTLGLLIAFSIFSPARADPGDLFVKPDGSGTTCSQASPCALQTALDQASDGDTIYVAGGTYTGTGAAVITVTRSITLYGGWDGAPSGPVVRDPAAYPTTLDGEQARRVVFVAERNLAMEGLSVVHGNASGLGGSPRWGDSGGGIYARSSSIVLRQVHIAENRATEESYNSAGGGLYLYGCNALLEYVQVENNQGRFGAGLYAQAGSLDVRDAGFSYNNNGDGDGGGAFIKDASGTWHNVTFEHNRSKYGGGLLLSGGSYTITRSIIRDNEASGLGGGLHIRGRIIGENIVIVRNRANRGSGLFIGGENTLALLKHVTLAQNVGQEGSAIYMWALYGPSTAYLTNTIIVSHTVGISMLNGPEIHLEGILWGVGPWANGEEWSGDGTVITGAINLWGDPRFLNPAGGDYHLGRGSAAIDAGVDAGVTTDIDSDARPIGAGYDIGADEYVARYGVYLPLVLRNH